MSPIRKRQAGMAGIVVAVSALLVMAFGSSNAGAIKVLKGNKVVSNSVPGLSQGTNNGDYLVHTVSASCPSGRKAVGANAFFTVPNIGTTIGDTGDELLIAGIKKTGNGYTAEGVSDRTAPYSFVIEVNCPRKVSV